MNYPTFSKREEKNINDFLVKLKKAFVVNRISNNRKYIVIASCLKGIAANFYDRLAEIIE